MDKTRHEKKNCVRWSTRSAFTAVVPLVQTIKIGPTSDGTVTKHCQTKFLSFFIVTNNQLFVCLLYPKLDTHSMQAEYRHKDGQVWPLPTTFSTMFLTYDHSLSHCWTSGNNNTHNLGFNSNSLQTSKIIINQLRDILRHIAHILLAQQVTTQRKTKWKTY